MYESSCSTGSKRTHTLRIHVRTTGDCIFYALTLLILPSLSIQIDFLCLPFLGRTAQFYWVPSPLCRNHFTHSTSIDRCTDSSIFNYMHAVLQCSAHNTRMRNNEKLSTPKHNYHFCEYVGRTHEYAASINEQYQLLLVC